MQRVGFLLKVKQDKVQEYRKMHEDVWPELLDALSRSGWHNYTLFIQDDGTIFGYCEVDESLQASVDGIANEEVNLRWGEKFAPYFEIPPGSTPDQSMVELEQYFHMD